MKNLKSIITNLIAILAGVLTYVFLSQPYLSYLSESVWGSSSWVSHSGYNFISSMDNKDAKVVTLGVANLIVAILAGLLILLAIFNLLTATGVVKVKNEKFACKLNSFISVLLVLTNIVVLICAICISSASAGSLDLFGTTLASGKYHIAWALILNFVLAFVALGATIIAGLGKKTKSKKK